MTLLYDSRQIRKIEQWVIAAGTEEYQLMERAGRFVFSILQQRWPDAQKIIFCTGKGNNAGDAYVAARLAHEHGLPVVIYAVTPCDQLKGSSAKAALACRKAGVSIIDYHPELSFDSDVLVDALFGIGLNGVLEEPYVSLINLINDQNIDILAIDVPSGLNADTGCIEGAAIDADVTVTFIGYKPGLVTLKGPSRCGEVILNTLDVPMEILNKIEPIAEFTEWERIQKVFPRRMRDAHKGDYGHVLVIGGDYGMGGAVRMAAEGALRVGAGLVSVATRPEHVPVVSSSRPEIMCHQVGEPCELIPLLEKVSVIVIGPGLGRTAWAEGLMQLVLEAPHPKLLDADALNLLSQRPSYSDRWVLTPHPGESARLLHCSCQELQLDRFDSLRELQKKYGGVVVLKGAGTLVKGKADRIKVCRAGNPGMATGGMGDILSGIIGGLMAQGLDLLTAAEIGVYVHARAGDLAVAEGGERGLLATDVLAYLRPLVNPN
ncbi:MAG: bifunctional ADP-dependent (S)-NAD(P)H-hydrate dehydratase/NAD(P)H-hydrate epimerase [Coxiella sp. RIFCSPHIGHO2_12_FULL_42_15]|nr:MAG: bifunctional ADP-dependent (S)-NAD(P)H-hydrate dehydratase/NAD(P)H-hydrate epimerase [Coxiella sp. RIFCSPHIGHO2_12_FULL_42_15]